MASVGPPTSRRRGAWTLRLISCAHEVGHRVPQQDAPVDATAALASPTAPTCFAKRQQPKEENVRLTGVYACALSLWAARPRDFDELTTDTNQVDRGGHATRHRSATIEDLAGAKPLRMPWLREVPSGWWSRRARCRRPTRCGHPSWTTRLVPMHVAVAARCSRWAAASNAYQPACARAFIRMWWLRVPEVLAAVW